MWTGGLLYYDGDSDEASLNPAMAAAMLMLRYAPMASIADKAESYVVCRRFDGCGIDVNQKFAQSQIDYMMGKNPMNGVFSHRST
jgi:endoglucanase